MELDLTTLHRTFKSTATDRGKRLNDLPDKKVPKKQKLSKVDAPAPADHDDLPQNHEAPAGAEPTSNSRELSSIQLLDLHTANPIISYKDEVFSCSWIDMIGTNMFFSQPKETPLYDPEISTADFDLIGTSRIKLVGNPMKVTPLVPTAVGSGANGETQTESLDVPDRPGKSLGTIRTTNAKVNADMRKQANFLEQLMNVKKNRGEQDNVHVIMNNKISKIIAAGKLKYNIQRRGEEINKLNRRIVRGDAEALRKLEQVYSGRDEDSEDEDCAAQGTAEVRDEKSPRTE